MINYGEKIGIVCCSNGQKKSNIEKIKALADILSDMGLQPVFSDYIYEKEGVCCGTPEERAEAVMTFYKEDTIKGIFDISGGDAANGILPYLDYDVIAKSKKMFWGYSDLTTVLNAIYAKTGSESVLYQIKNLIYKNSVQQKKDFENTVLQNEPDLFHIDYYFIQGKEMQGIVVGGNIRCFLKLAGTEYMPNLDNKILLLESFGGMSAKIETYLHQLKQIGAFDKITGILLGTFTEMETEQCIPTAEMLVKKLTGEQMPIAVTRNIGHGTDSKAMVIGRELYLIEKNT